MEYRKVKKVYLGVTLEKDRKVRLVRFLGPDSVTDASPFLLLENMRLKTATEFEHGFPWRPCAGVESVLYFIKAPARISKAELAAGDPHWIQVGVNQVEDCVPGLEGPVLGVQIWIGATDEPASGEPVAEASSLEVADGARARVVAGNFGSAEVLTKTASGAVVLDVFMEKHAEWLVSTLHDSVVIANILEGDGYFEENEDEVFSAGRTLLFTEGTTLFVKAGARGMRFLLLAAPPKAVPAPNWDEVRKTEDDWIELLDEEEGASKRGR